ncbi:MAG TPA: ribosome assembly RNA-binding protein YhbY [Gammaproteobacteria bacterium]|jgi:RNA-binding protein|nr:ribosome assembly RNA-binding protein YhbY [Gammaproteobacteria bacterium]
MKLTDQQKRHLRGLGHALKPVVILGNAGLTENVLAEIDQALAYHELIKVRINAADREQRTAIIDAICEQTKGDPVQCIGHILLIFRRNPKKRRVSLNAAD